MIENLIDTNILIDIWRGNKSHWSILNSCSNYISTIVYIEFLQGAKEKQKVEAEEFLQQFVHIPLTPKISLLAIDLICQYAQTGGLRLADSLFAATCMAHDFNLLTLNRKHFQNIGGLKLI